jgi:hypothetical protein
VANLKAKISADACTAVTVGYTARLAISGWLRSVEKGFRDEIWNAQAELAAKLSRENFLETLC